MNKDRCPWCGKKIRDHHANRKRLGLSYPAGPLQIEGKCSECDKKYGRNAFSSRMLKVYLLALVCMVVGLFGLYPLVLVIIIVPFALSAEPLSRLDDEMVPQEFDKSLKHEVKWMSGTVGKKEILLLDPATDDAKAFDVVSPILIHSVNKKESKLTVYFLYDNEKNAEYMEREKVELYNGDRQKVAEIAFK